MVSPSTMEKREGFVAGADKTDAKEEYRLLHFIAPMLPAEKCCHSNETGD